MTTHQVVTYVVSSPTLDLPVGAEVIGVGVEEAQLSVTVRVPVATWAFEVDRSVSPPRVTHEIIEGPL